MKPIHPNVTVVMPVRNEAKTIRRSLQAVLNQDYPKRRLEIIVADGMSKDGTRAILKEIQEKNPNLQLIDNPAQIVPTALNRAIVIARGDIIARVDGHCQIAPNYVSRCVEHFQKGGIDAVGGSIHTVGETYSSRAIAIAMSTQFGVGDSAFRTVVNQTKVVDTVPFPTYTRLIIERAGLYDEELVRNQDDEYNYRLGELGGTILLAADINSKYYSRSTIGSLWCQYYQYGFWKVRVMQKHPHQMRLRQFVPFSFVCLLICSLMLALFTATGFYLFALIGGFYLLANLGASIWAAAHRGWRYLPMLPLVHTSLHLSYGVGFLNGLLRFAGRWGDKRGKVPSWEEVRSRLNAGT